MTLEFANLSTTQASHVDVIARTVCFVIVAIAAKMKQIQFVNQALFFQEIDGAIYSYEVDLGTDLLRALEDLVNVEMLLGVVHDLKDDATLTREADAPLPKGLLEMSSGIRRIDAFAGRDAMRWRG